MTTTVIFSSCKDDKDEQAPTTGNIVGTWVSVDTEVEGTISYTKTYTLNFTNNGTGYRKQEVTASTGATSSDMYTFRYTVATKADGTLLLTTVDDDDNYTSQYNVTQTGNTLLFGSRIYVRK